MAPAGVFNAGSFCDTGSDTGIGSGCPRPDGAFYGPIPIEGAGCRNANREERARIRQERMARQQVKTRPKATTPASSPNVLRGKQPAP